MSPFRRQDIPEHNGVPAQTVLSDEEANLFITIDGRDAEITYPYRDGLTFSPADMELIIAVWRQYHPAPPLEAQS